MDLATAYRCAQASLAAYKNPHLFAQACNVTVETFDWNPIASLIACDAGEMILVFRGTVLARAADAQERWDTMLGGMLFNFDFAQVDGYGGRVHRGFAAALDKIWPRLLEQLARLDVPGRRLVITGHSKGAALATLAAWRLHREGRAIAGVYTFGSPRVGNAAFAANYPLRLCRFEYRDDPVPHLPPPPRLARQLEPFLGQWVAVHVDYQHAGSLYFLDWSGNLTRAGATPVLLNAVRGGRLLVKLVRERRQALADHSCEMYAEGLRRVISAARV